MIGPAPMMRIVDISVRFGMVPRACPPGGQGILLCDVNCLSRLAVIARERSDEAIQTKP